MDRSLLFKHLHLIGAQLGGRAGHLFLVVPLQGNPEAVLVTLVLVSSEIFDFNV